MIPCVPQSLPAELRSYTHSEKIAQTNSPCKKLKFAVISLLQEAVDDEMEDEEARYDAYDVGLSNRNCFNTYSHGLALELGNKR